MCLTGDTTAHFLGTMKFDLWSIPLRPIRTMTASQPEHDARKVTYDHFYWRNALFVCVNIFTDKWTAYYVFTMMRCRLSCRRLG